MVASPLDGGGLPIPLGPVGGPARGLTTPSPPSVWKEQARASAGPIHGVRVVSTAATAAGTAWVVNGNGVVIYRRGGITAQVGTNTTDFIENWQGKGLLTRVCTQPLPLTTSMR
jgi:hypothetical protein